MTITIMRLKFFTLVATVLPIGFILFLNNPAFAQFDETNDTGSVFYYSGLLGQERIECNLQFNNQVVSGSYIMERTGDIYVFNGRITQDKKEIGIIIFDQKDEFVATVEAELTSQEKNFAKVIKGTWKAADGSQMLVLQLTKVAELAQAPITPDEKLYGMTMKPQIIIKNF